MRKIILAAALVVAATTAGAATVAGIKVDLSSWRSMKKGQTIVLTYVPGIGTTVKVAGTSKGTLGGKAVSDAILNTWVGPKPGPGADFKKGVLGQ